MVLPVQCCSTFSWLLARVKGRCRTTLGQKYMFQCLCTGKVVPFCKISDLTAL